MSLRKAIIILSTLASVALAALPAAAQLKQLTIPDTTAKKGDTLLVPIRISALANGDSVYSGQLTLSYNGGVMTVYGVQTSGTLTQGTTSYFNATTRQFSFASGTIITGSGVLVYLKVGTFLAPSAMTDSLRIASAILNEGAPPISIDNGYFRFLSITVAPKSPSSSFAVGDSLLFIVSGDQQLPLTWSTSNSSVGSITSAGLLKGVGVGQIKVFVTDARGLKDSTNLFAVNSAQLTSLNLRVRDTSFTQTLFFNLPIYISDVSALGIYSGQFSLSFNSSILQASDVITAGSLTAGWSAPAFNISGGKIDVALAGGTPLSGGGILTYVRFRVLPGASGSTALTLSSVLFNENINATLTNGTFYTISAPTVVVSPSTATLTRGDTLRFNVLSGGTPPYIWTSTNTGAATINSSTGLLTAVTRGTTTVKVVDSFGFNTTTGTINVNDLRVILPDTVVAASDSVDVPVQVEDLTGLGIYSYDLRIAYDSTIVRFAALLSTGTMSNAMTFAVRDTLDTLRVGGAGASALTGSGQLLKLRFKAAPGVTNGQISTLAFPFFRFNEIGGSTPTATTVNGRLTIGTLANLVPAQPTLLSPVSGQTNVAVNPTLGWNAASRATTYNLQVSTASDFSALVVNQTGLTSTSYAASGLANNTLYYWRVSATNTNGSSAYSTTLSFTTVVAPPAAPTLAVPADSATGIATNPVLSWNASANAATYTVQISTSSSFSSFVANQSGIAGTSYNAGGLSTSTQYFWRVSASNAGGTSAFSTARSFTTSPPPPAAPTLVSPADSATGISVSPTLSWNASAGATSYTVQVSTNSGFSSFVANQSGVTGTSYSASGLSNLTQYFWRVSATNAGGTSAYSSARVFTTTSLGPPVPVLATPANGDTGIVVSPTLSWNPSSGATSYTLQVSAASNFSTLITSQTGLTGTLAVVGPLGTSTVYYWRVSATNGSGTSAYSSASSFRTVMVPPPVPTLVSPANYAVDLGLSQTLKWNSVLGATSYALQIAFDSLFTSFLNYEPSLADTSYVPTAGLANSMTYYWRVRASNAGGSSSYSPMFRFSTIIAPPPTGNIVSPANGTSGLPVSPTLTWHALARATSYNVQVSTDMSFGSYVVNQTGLADTTYVAAGLSPNTTYYWRVSGTNAGGTGPWSAGYNFVTGAGAPSAPTLTSPANTATGVALTPTFNWSASIGATSYRLQLSTVSDFSSTVLDSSGITGTSLATGALSGNTVHYWRVSATNASGTSAPSGAFSFTTAVGIPAAPTLSSPANAATGIAVNPTLSWNGSPGATSYRLQVSTAADFSVIVKDSSGIGGTTLGIGPLSNNTVYYWHVSATNASGTSTYSSTFSFTTALSTPVLVAPHDTATGVSVGPTLSWNAVTGATSYTLLVSTTSNFSTLTVNLAGLTGTSYLIGPLAGTTQYYWRVIATDGSHTGTSPVWSFTTSIWPPLKPTLSAPADGATNVLSTAQLSWLPDTGAVTYNVQVSTASDFSALVYSQAGITATQVPVSSFWSDAKVYYWRVSATNAGGTSAYSSAFSFTTIVAAPTAPVLSSPADGATGVSVSPTLSWDASTGASSYTLQVSTVADFSALIVNQSGIGSTSSSIGPLVTNTVYYWRVSATSPGGTSAYSSAFSFSTVAPTPPPPPATPAAPSLASPVNGTTNVPVSPYVTLTWNASSGATSYRLQISKAPDFSNIVVNQGGITGTSLPVVGLNTNTVYYWRMSAASAGGSSAFSSAFSFTTVSPPLAPTLAIPSNGASGVALSPVLSWNASAGATSYTLQVSTLADFSTFVLNQAGISGTADTVGPLTVNTSYYWRVSAVNSIGSSPFSASSSFITTSGIPGTPKLQTPSDSVPDVALPPTFRWSATPGALSYTLQVSRSPSFSPAAMVIVSQSGITDTTYSLGGSSRLREDTVYYWRVSAVGPVGTSAFSTPFSFSTQYTARWTGPSPIGSTPVPQVPTLRWTQESTTRPKSFEVQVSTLLDFSVLVADKVVSPLSGTVRFDGATTVGPLTPGATYYWRVRAIGFYSTTSFSPAARFSVRSGVPSPTLVSPADSATNVAYPRPTLSWNAVDGALSYTLQIANSPGFADATVYTVSGLTDTNYTFTSSHRLVEDQLYYWHVKASDSLNTSAYSSTFSFSTDITAPRPRSPFLNAVNVAAMAQLVWEDQTGIASPSFTVQVSTSSDFSTFAVNKTLTSRDAAFRGDPFRSGSIVVGPLAPNTKYYWRVNTIGVHSTSAFSTVSQFTVRNGVPSPTLALPLDGTKDASLTPKLVWNQVDGATSYSLQLSASSRFSPATTIAIDATGIIDTSFTIPSAKRLSPDSIYYWRVSATDSLSTSVYSTSFTLATTFPENIRLATPRNGLTGVTLSPAMSWDHYSLQAVNFTLQVSTSLDFDTVAFEKTVPRSGSLMGRGVEIGPLALNTMYYWRVRSNGTYGVSGFSYPWRFTTTTGIPGVPNPTMPTDSSKGVSVNPTLSWAAGSGAVPTSYTLQVSLAPDFSSFVANKSGITGASFGLTGLSYNTVYYWRVSAAAEASGSAFSNVFMFTTAPGVPVAPTLQIPMNGATALSINPVLEWSKSLGAKSYTLEVSPVASFTPARTDTYAGITDTTFAVGPLGYNAVVYWRVSAVGELGASPPSRVFSFMTATAIPPIPILLSPSNGATSVSVSPVLRWHSSPGSMSYTVEISTNAKFSLKLTDQYTDITDTSFAVGSLTKGVKYYWHVRATGAKGESENSAMFAFTIASSATEVEMVSGLIPETYTLQQNYPNPFNPSTRITFSLPHRSSVRLSVYSIVGSEVAVLLDGERQAGIYEARFDAGAFTSGVYFLRVTATPLDGEDRTPFVATRKMVLLK